MVQAAFISNTPWVKMAWYNEDGKKVDSKEHMQYFNVQICTCKLRRLNIWKLCWEILLCRTIHDPYLSTMFWAESTPYCPPETIRQDPQCLSHMLFVFFIQRFGPQNLKPFKPIKSLAWNDFNFFYGVSTFNKISSTVKLQQRTLWKETVRKIWNFTSKRSEYSSISPCRIYPRHPGITVANKVPVKKPCNNPGDCYWVGIDPTYTSWWFQRNLKRISQNEMGIFPR